VAVDKSMVSSRPMTWGNFQQYFNFHLLPVVTYWSC